MATSLKILFLSAEVAPFAKTGGLGDVCGSLPKALRALGHEVRVVMPAYRSLEQAAAQGKWGLRPMPGVLSVPTGAGLIPAGVFTTILPGSDVPLYMIAERNLFDRPNIYGYNDDAYRFAFFSRAALELTVALDWRPDVVHAHDWHSAPALTWLATTGQSDDRFRGIAGLFTIHNLAHQGRAGWEVMKYLGVSATGMLEEGLGEVNFMARGIYHATLINTVSPNYAREILQPEHGLGLERLLRFRHYDLHGILNGVDDDLWNPTRDPKLASTFDAEHLEARAANKAALQARANLPQRPDVPLVAMVTRLDWQKGLDITGHVIHLLLNDVAGPAQFVVLGTGAAEYEGMFAQLAGYHRDKMAAFLDFQPDLAPLIYGGSDLFLMPSRFEPCGLGQLIAMRYGSVPVVRATGGLADTVREGRTGFTFIDYSGEEFWHALQQALYIYRVDQASWRQIQLNGMKTDFSWRQSAYGYQQLCEWAVARVRGL